MAVNKTLSRMLAAVSVIAVLSDCDYKPRNQGRALYEKHCQSCHMEKGQGLGALIPPVAQADYVIQRKAELACIIRYGISGKITVNGLEYEGEMDGNSRLTEVEINNLIYYVLVELNGQEKAFEISEIRRQLEACAEHEK